MTAKVLHRELLQQCKTIYNDGEAAAITSIIFECVTGLYKSDIIMRPERILPEQQQLRIKECISEVLTQKPVQYITGEAWFDNLKLHVTEDVLIPRPETEQLAEMAIEFLKDREGTCVLDIGTGSGCIPISLKYHLPQCEIMAIDISAGALQIARHNAREHNVEIDFKEIDFLDRAQWKKLPVFDAIVSNPPYIPLQEKPTLQKNVQLFEPAIALFVPDESPLLFYEHIALFAKDHLAPDGQLFMEVHEKYAREAGDYFRNNGYLVNIVRDLFGKDRIITATHSR